ncbi:MAG TPA: hypothetical protein VFB85_18600 [Vicinamibacterales bacterium]|jgi:type II secretory pathway pseudopilin PulG|nr:hypothetical protein [Vicinamibacterales bacterium]
MHEASRGRSCGERGASLIEAMLAAVILSVAVVAIAQLFSIGASTNVEAKSRTVAAILASQKIEQLRALGAHSDLNSGGSLTEDSAGFVDYLDANSAVIDDGSPQRSGVVYTRRWSIVPAPESLESLRIVQVRVVGKGTLAQVVTMTGRGE